MGFGDGTEKIWVVCIFKCDKSKKIKTLKKTQGWTTLITQGYEK